MTDPARHAPIVSIVTAAYNAANTIAETVETVLAQSYAEWELIVVDDGSTDDTAAVVHRYAESDSRIRLITQENAGTARARNTGVGAARAGWLCMLDADDLLVPEFLERMLAFEAVHPGYDIYSPRTLVLLRDGTSQPLMTGRQWGVVRSVSVADQLNESHIAQVSLVRREVFDRAGGYRDVYSEDYDFWLRCLILGARQIQNPEPLWLYRRQAGSKTTALVKEAESLLQILTDARAMPELPHELLPTCDRAIEFAEARIGRRRLEEALLAGRFEGARRAYWAYRRAFPGRLKFWVGLVLITVSPRAYASLKARRMV